MSCPLTSTVTQRKSFVLLFLFKVGNAEQLQHARNGVEYSLVVCHLIQHRNPPRQDRSYRIVSKRKLKQREVKQVSQGHTASKWGSWELNS